MMLMFCPANNLDGSEKDSLRNAKLISEGGTGAFVINVATHDQATPMAGTADPIPPDASEFDHVGWTPLPSTRVAPPRVAESPISFECETAQVIRTNGDSPGGGNIVLGRVVWVHVDDAPDQREDITSTPQGSMRSGAWEAGRTARRAIGLRSRDRGRSNSTSQA